MGLTWEEFLKLATIIANLSVSIYYSDRRKIKIEEKNRRVAAAAGEYQELFNDSHYMQFMNEVR